MRGEILDKRTKKYYHKIIIYILKERNEMYKASKSDKERWIFVFRMITIIPMIL